MVGYLGRMGGRWGIIELGYGGVGKLKRNDCVIICIFGTLVIRKRRRKMCFKMVHRSYAPMHRIIFYSSIFCFY